MPSGELVEIDTNDYKKYGAPICNYNRRYMRVMAHIIEPDGNILVADPWYYKLSFNNYIFDCKIHSKAYGCKHHLERDCAEFIYRHTNCRCFAKIATQSDYDKYCYKSGHSNFVNSDNAKVYKDYSYINYF